VPVKRNIHYSKQVFVLAVSFYHAAVHLFIRAQKAWKMSLGWSTLLEMKKEKWSSSDLYTSTL